MATSDRIKIPESFWQAVEDLGIRRSAVIQEAALPLTVVNSDARMSTAQLFSIWRALEALGGADIGHDLMTVQREATMPPSFLIALHAKNLGESLNRVARFKSLCAPEEFEIATDGDDCIVTTSWPYASEAEPKSLVDANFTFLVKIARAGVERDIAPRKIELQRVFSKKLADWFDCPIFWEAPQARLIWRKSDLKLPFATYNRELLELLDAQLDQQLENQKTRPSFSELVRWHLRRSLAAGRTELRYIALEMALSERSLQRRLREEGYSFQGLLSDTRRQLAHEFLQQPDFDIGEIAYLLGYENRGSFYRAFQKWEDQAPGEWRRKTQGLQSID